MLDWNDLKFVLAIAEAGTLSGATRLVKASQPTVSRRLAEMESTLGLDLFERGPDGYRLTSAGRRVHGWALQMEFEARRIERDLQGDAAPQGHLVVTTTEDFGFCCLTPALAKFHRQFPDISIDTVLSGDAIADLRRIADIAIRIGNPKSENFERTRVGSAYFAIYGALDYLEQFGEPKSLGDLRHHEIIGSSGDVAGLMQTSLLSDLSDGASVHVSSDNMMNQLAAVQAGMGLVALPTYLAAGNDTIRRVLPASFNPSQDVWILTHKHLAHTDRIRALVDFLTVELAQSLKSDDPLSRH